jgi:polysaccharide export outer membrane protein
MSAGRWAGWAGMAVLALGAGCSTLPAAGPSAAAMKRSHDVDVVKVTPELAAQAAAAADQAEQASIAAAVQALSAAPPAAPQSFVFGPGSSLKVTLWSVPPQLTAAAAPTATPLGDFTVSAEGEIQMPYVGAVRLEGLGLDQAQALIRSRYAALRMFQAPSIGIEAASSPRGQVIVTGAVGQPRILAWPPQGLTLAEALTQALGDGATLLGVAEDSADRTPAVQVAVLRQGMAPVALPAAAALDRQIALRPGDKVVVRKAAEVQVTVLGAGVKTDGVMGFSEPPALSTVLARASGLDSNVADNHAVFVFRQRPGARPVLYDFSWDRAEGLIASHRFPLQSGDMVYVAEAPIVSIERVVNIFFQLAVPAETLR